MIRKLSNLLKLLVFLLTTNTLAYASPKADEKPQDYITESTQTVPMVQGRDEDHLGYFTGFVVKENGSRFLYTALHALGPNIKILSKNDIFFHTEIDPESFIQNQNKDMARTMLTSRDLTEYATFKLSRTRLKVRDELTISGFPNQKPLTLYHCVFLGQTLVAFEGDLQGYRIMNKAYCPASPPSYVLEGIPSGLAGISGGPVLNSKGEAVGVISAVSKAFQGLFFFDDFRPQPGSKSQVIIDDMTRTHSGGENFKALIDTDIDGKIQSITILNQSSGPSSKASSKPSSRPTVIHFKNGLPATEKDIDLVFEKIIL